jgi:hypothetical protein
MGSDPVITPEVEEPEEKLDEAVEEEDKEFNQEFSREQQEMSQAVQESAHELEQLSGARLTASLAAELTGLATMPHSNSMEIITHPAAPGSRLDVLSNQLGREGKVADLVVGRAKVDLLATLLGHNLTEGMNNLDAMESATTLLTHVIYAAKGQPLPDLTASPAKNAIIDIGDRIAKRSDKSFWNLFATAYDGTVADPDILKQQLAVMALTHELQPLKTDFTWPSGDSKALQVDELVAAARIDPDYIDLSRLYRRARTLNLNGTPIPRAVMTELIRLAIADILTTGRWKPAQARTPDAATISQLLDLEPISPGSPDQKVIDRNSARNSAKALLKKSEEAVRGKPSAEARARATASRASRGHLPDLVNFLLTRTKTATAAIPGGAKAVSALDDAVQKSSLLPALELWSASYRKGEDDPVKLKILLDNVSESAQLLIDGINQAFPSLGAVGSPETNASAFIPRIKTSLREVALEAAELLRTPPSVSSDPLAGPARVAETSTVRVRTRMAAIDAINGKGKLSEFIKDNLPKELKLDNWAQKLLKGATTWDTAETRDTKSLIDAASQFIDTLKLASTDLQKSWTPGTVFLGEGMIDALASAVKEKITALSAADPQVKAQLVKQLADLAGYQLPDKTIVDPAKYWQTTKKAVSGVPHVGLDLATKLSAWQSASANPSDTVSLIAATYNVVDALIGNHLAISGSSLADGDKAVLLRALDDLGISIAGKMSTLVSH